MIRVFGIIQLLIIALQLYSLFVVNQSKKKYNRLSQAAGETMANVLLEDRKRREQLGPVKPGYGYPTLSGGFSSNPDHAAQEGHPHPPQR